MNPLTKKEWQEAADAADAMLTLNAALTYDLVDGSIQVDVRRCLYILVEARDKHGITPRRELINAHILGALDRERHRAQANRPHQPTQF